MILLFTVTLFLSSSLLFVVQPMIGKMVLPLLGGTPAVWNTCMVFFQGMLLAGYLYAHAITRWLRFPHQALLHIVLLAASFLTLPMALAAQHAEPPAMGMPVGWLLRVLLLTVGFPFFLVSASAPLLQRWFSNTDHPSARDPYFLSVAGNVGSIFALLAYPALLEPTLRVGQQGSMWSIGYVLLTLLTAVSFYVAYRRSQSHRPMSESSPDVTPAAEPRRPLWRERLHWIALSFVPSSLLLGVTTFLTTDVAAVPLLWVVPLVIYLLSFVLVFARRMLIPHTLMLRMLPLWVLPLTWLIVFDTTLSVGLQAPIHLLTFFFAAMVCHGELARRRPDSRYLTEFYLSMSVGGVLGGLFNALVAPLLFNTVMEYPIALVLACALRPAPADTSRTRVARTLDFALPIVVGGLTLAMMFLLNVAESNALPMRLLTFLVPALVCFSFAERPLRFALTLGALMIAAGTYGRSQEAVAHRGRSFFGVHRVVNNAEQNARFLVHGGIIHGAQYHTPAGRREPTMYYHRNGPIGQVLTELDASPDKHVGVVGLGVGTLAAYAAAGQRWTFFEIDPAIADLANDGRHFTYLSDSPADTRIVLGDARIALEREQQGSFDVLVIDAFSSDAIPVHLLTREALQLYLEKVKPDGVIAFHISNTFLRIAPLVGSLARDAGLVCLERFHAQDPSVPVAKATTTQWVVMARSADALGPLVRDARWRQIPEQPAPQVWTDDFSNPLSLVRWMGK